MRIALRQGWIDELDERKRRRSVGACSAAAAGSAVAMARAITARIMIMLTIRSTPRTRIAADDNARDPAPSCSVLFLDRLNEV